MSDDDSEYGDDTGVTEQPETDDEREPQPDQRTQDIHIATHIIAGEYAHGQTVTIRGLTLERLGLAGNIWALYDEDDQYVDSIQAGRARSAKEFLKFVHETLTEDESRWAV